MNVAGITISTHVMTITLIMNSKAIINIIAVAVIKGNMHHEHDVNYLGDYNEI